MYALKKLCVYVIDMLLGWAIEETSGAPKATQYKLEGYLLARSEKMIVHLVSCPFQSQATKDEALRINNLKRTGASAMPTPTYGTLSIDIPPRLQQVCI